MLSCPQHDLPRHSTECTDCIGAESILKGSYTLLASLPVVIDRQQDLRGLRGLNFNDDALPTVTQRYKISFKSETEGRISIKRQPANMDLTQKLISNLRMCKIKIFMECYINYSNAH